MCQLHCFLVEKIKRSSEEMKLTISIFSFLSCVHFKWVVCVVREYISIELLGKKNSEYEEKKLFWAFEIMLFLLAIPTHCKINSS